MQRAAQAASIMYDEESDKLACQVPAQGQEQVPVPPGDWVAVHEIVYIGSTDRSLTTVYGCESFPGGLGHVGISTFS
ncbi:hypothetical protein PENFLA_c042G08647, partial [Penicillium flavigenum]